MKLDRAVDVIVDESDEPAGDELADDGEGIGADDLREMLGGVTFEDEDVRDLLEEGFAAAAEFFGSDHWRLTPRQARMLGKPVAQLLNALWARVMRFLPDYFERWCNELPGLAGVVTACALVVGPKAVKQWRLSRKTLLPTGERVPLSTPMREAPAVSSPSSVPSPSSITSSEVIAPRVV